MNEPAVRLSKVDLKRGRAFSLRVESLEIRQGLTIVSGPNGAGKSTLLECLTGAHRRHVGTWSVNGHGSSTDSDRQVYSVISYVPQPLVLPSRWPVADYLRYACWLKAVPGHLVSERINEVATTLNVSRRLETRISRLSGGLQRRVLVGQALVNQPQILVMDEPFSGLDRESMGLVVSLIERFASVGAVVVADHSGTMDRVEHRPVRLHEGHLES